MTEVGSGGGSLSDLDVELLKCRTLGHAWEDFIPVAMQRPSFGERLSFRCVRCATERHDICSWIDGSLVQREYRYQNNYAIESRHTRSEFRLALLTTLRPRRRKRT